MLLIIIISLLQNISFAERFHTDYYPVNVRGYVVQQDHHLAPTEIEEAITPKYSTKFEENLHQIQKKYSITQTYNEITPFDKAQKQNRIKGYTKVTDIAPESVEISTSAMQKLCKDMGFNEKTQRNTLEFYECITQAMKTKFTEETLRKKTYNKIDSNIALALQPRTSVDIFVKNLTQYQELLSRRNKMDCLNENNYYKCIKAITEYKTCHNKIIDETKIEHSANKVICYVKTGIRFPNPMPEEVSTRDSYYGMCVHLIEKDLRKKLFEENGKCNQILTKNNFMHLTI